MRADWGLTKGDGGGIVTMLTLVGGADIGMASSLDWSHRLQLLAREVAGESLLSGAEVEVNEALVAEDVTETGRLPSKTNRVLVPVDAGLERTGDSVLRKSR